MDKNKFLISGLLLILNPLFIEAGYRMGEEKIMKTHTGSSGAPLKKFDFLAKNSLEDPEEAALSALSRRYSLSMEKLKYFRSLHHGYEEIVPALIVAREAQVEAGRILQLRMSNKSWKDIAQSFDVDLKPLNDEVLNVLSPLRKKLPKRAIEERPRNAK